MKYKWKVSEPPTGRYRSFHKRAWPSAYYLDPEKRPAALMNCEKSYHPKEARSGNHPELTVRVADHSQKPFKWLVLKKHFATIDEAKDGFEEFRKKYPHIQPKEVSPCLQRKSL